jgi:hypothetical protein
MNTFAPDYFMYNIFNYIFMKRLNKFLVIACFTGAMFVSCTKESIIDDYGVENPQISGKRNERTVSEVEAKSFISAVTKGLFVDELIPIVEGYNYYCLTVSHPYYSSSSYPSISDISGVFRTVFFNK